MKKSIVLFNKKVILTFFILLLLAFILTQYLSENSASSKIQTQTNIQTNIQTTDKQGASSSELMESKQGFNSSEDILKLKMFRLATIDGDIRADEDGRLIIDRDLRHWIDFYLSAIGELSLSEIKQLMAEKIAQLPMPAREQAETLLAEYLSYKEALASYEGQFEQLLGSDHLDNLQQRHNWQKRLRREALSSEAVEAFWLLDELVDDYALEQLVINGSDSSEEEKLSQLKKLEAALPKELKEFRSDLYIASNLQETVEISRQQGDSDEVIRQLRIEEVGLDATDRLEVLEARQNVWQQRIIAYADEMKAVAAIEGVTEQDKLDQIDSYQQNNFDEREQLRLETALRLLADD
ncbi:MAG: lipase secretion chaperone [Oleispira sp.]